MQNAMPIIVIIKAALSELSRLQALHLAHFVLHSVAFSIPSFILSKFLPLVPEAERLGYGSHPVSTTCMLKSTVLACLCDAALLSVSLDIIFFFVIEMLVSSFVAFICLITDYNLFCCVSPLLPSCTSSFPHWWRLGSVFAQERDAKKQWTPWSYYLHPSKVRIFCIQVLVCGSSLSYF